MVGIDWSRPHVYGCWGASNTLACRADFHGAARVHHQDVVGGLRDHAQIVRDQDHADVELVLDPFDQLEDLGLDGDVERGRRLVGDQDRGCLFTSAIAIIARCRIPPENWCG